MLMINIANMKKIKFSFAFIFLTMIYHTVAQKSINMSLHNCFSAPIKYTVEGKLKKGILIFINYNDVDMPALQYSDVYLLTKNSENTKTTSDSCIYTNIYNIEVSENSLYLALFKVGEGHPWIEIYDLQILISEQKQLLIATINPYPGYVNMLKWKGDFLIIESDVNLLLINENKDLAKTENFDNVKKFKFNIQDKKFSNYK